AQLTVPKANVHSRITGTGGEFQHRKTITGTNSNSATVSKPARIIASVRPIDSLPGQHDPSRFLPAACHKDRGHAKRGFSKRLYRSTGFERCPNNIFDLQSFFWFVEVAVTHARPSRLVG